MGELIEGFKEAIIPTILVVVVPTTFLGFFLSGGNLSDFFLKALPLIILIDFGANLLNNYSDWSIDEMNRKRLMMHKAFKRQRILLIYIIFIMAILIILIASGASSYLWAVVGLSLLAGIFYSSLVKLKDIPMANYATIALSYAILAFAIGFFSGSSNLALFEKWSPILIFLTLVYLGYSMTKDYSDVKGDRAHNKNTLPVLLGKSKTVQIQFGITTMAYAYLVFVIFIGSLQKVFLLLFISYFIAVYIIYNVHRTEDKKVHLAMHYHSQRNALLVVVIILLIMFFAL